MRAKGLFVPSNIVRPRSKLAVGIHGMQNRGVHKEGAHEGLIALATRQFLSSVELLTKVGIPQSFKIS
ncbi:protein of unknown function [Legionella fallonii LLAP-10]|uniref:Uncharacterized protein n=1 Tax=Legionella fallonii LLAP-10 TaxID=1212491 RepID=A0A098G4F5_9GAMM|nr:protein of unknown function [Legionella fallonii LLAP-10]